MFKENKLSLGLVFPLESYAGSIPIMDLEEQMKLAKLAEELDFATLFVRDIPLNDPSFGDAGQVYDPWIFLAYVAAHTEKITLATGSIITSLRHPLHVAKAAASLDQISRQRLILGIATGDRPIEFSAFGVEREERAALFQESLRVMKQVWKETSPQVESARVQMNQGDILPKPSLGDIPVLVTGHSGQSPEWIAEHSDGWLYYPRGLEQQHALIQNWRMLTKSFKPFSQSLYVDLLEDPKAEPKQIQLGFQTGSAFLIEFLKTSEAIGVNHVMLNLKFGGRPAEDVIQQLGEEVVPLFPSFSK